MSSASSTIKKVEVPKPPSEVNKAENNTKKSSISGPATAASGGENGASDDPVEGEDTMKNLRKTFAGIFGEIGQ